MVEFAGVSYRAADAHAHIYPGKIAEKATASVGAFYDLNMDNVGLPSVLLEQGGWPYHLLTEDLQFSAECAAEGRRIGYCEGAVIYDEQPTSFRQSWDQRLRW